MSLPINKIVLGDCTKVMKDFPENSIDCIATDPPYGMSFMGKEWDEALPPKDAFKEMCRILKPGGLAFVMSSPRQDLMWRMAQMLEESGFELGQSFLSWIYNTGFPKAYDISKGIDQHFGLERKKIGESHAGFLSQNKVFEMDDTDYGDFDVTEPASEEAKKFDGWKSATGLKPALEVIFMVQKPMTEKTIVDNVLKWGTGGMNVNATRIPVAEDDIINGKLNSPDKMIVYGKFNQSMCTPDNNGRFPANLLVSDDALDNGEVSSLKRAVVRNDVGKYGIYGKYGEHFQESGYDDVGSNSRYFDLDAWAKHYGFLQVPKASTSEREAGVTGEKDIPKSKFNLNNGQEDERFDGGKVNPRANIHPTVKPVKLMAYLIELGCPPDGIVLDPFVGSGTTCVAAKVMNKKYIGIEITEEYFKIAEEKVFKASFTKDLEVIKEPFAKVEQKNMTDLTNYWG